MRVTREMCFNETDVYTDLLYIVTRSLGVNPMRTSLEEVIAKRLEDGDGYSETISTYRTYLEQLLERALKGAERA